MQDLLSMFAREVDFKLEVTINPYVACRALSVRARDINVKFRQLPEGTEGEQPNPTIGAFSDYSVGRIDLKAGPNSGDEESPAPKA